MKTKAKIKILIDFVMTISLLFLMAYELVGSAAHEWVGIGMFALFVAHHLLNWKWIKNLTKGKYTIYRTTQSVLVAFVFLSMLGSMISGIILSRHVFTFLSIGRGQLWARYVHMVCAYGGFVFMSLHLGLHWSMMMGMARKLIEKKSHIREISLRGIAIIIAGYGVLAFIKRDIGAYMFLQKEYVFFDFEEPLIYFFADYVAIMGLFVFAGYYITKGFQGIYPKKN